MIFILASSTFHLVDSAKAYPPNGRLIDVWIDYDKQLARVDVLKGHDASKSFLLLYSSNSEYMIRSGEFAACKRSFLTEKLQMPRIPPGFVFSGSVPFHHRVNGGRSSADRWIDETTNPNLRATMLCDPSTKWPLQLSIETKTAAGGSTAPFEKVVTYNIEEIKSLDDVDDAPLLFRLPEPYITESSCTHHVGGWPSIHAFHTFLRL